MEKKHTFKNPIDISTADPVILYHEGRYYLYGTNNKAGFFVFSSEDLADWKPEGMAFERYDGFYGVDHFWAPEVYYRNGRFIMVFSCRDENKIHSITIATSESPTGPFHDIGGGRPVYSTGYSIIDGNLLFDDDGKVYLYYSRDCSMNIVDGIHESHIYVVELSPTLDRAIGEPVFCTSPDCEWEKKSGAQWRWNEGPCVFKRNGIYYLMYTANFYASIHYAVGYATSTSPTGPFVKSDSNPILTSDGESTMGTGHNNYFFSPDKSEMWCVYHSLRNRKNNDNGRVPNIDRMLFDADGALSIAGPTVTEQSLPSGTVIK